MHAAKSAVAALSIASNATLLLGKLTVGLLIGSVSIISEAIHSGVDLIASVIAFVAVRTSAKPADAHHPYGHGKYENLSGAIEALLILGAAAWIIIEAIHKLKNPQPIGHVGIGIVVMLVSSLVNWLISQRLFRIGRQTDSIALQADAWHLRIDVYTSAGVMAGLGLIWLGQRLLPGTNLAWIDPVAALGVTVLILKAAWDLTAESVRDLLDASLPEHEEQWIVAHIKSQYPTVSGVHDMRTRKGGSTRFIEFHLIVPAQMSVRQSHDISDEIERDIERQYPVTHVSIHVEPCQQPCPKSCLPGCFRAANVG
jgi:cation diffusion facilitator family transporter